MYPYSETYQIAKRHGESNDQYQYRSWFIAHQKPKTMTQFIEAERQSVIAASIHFLKCQYNQDVMMNSIYLQPKVDGFTKSL